MTVRRWHKVIGVTLILPMVGWAVTGLVFFLKPGYAGAYESLAVRTYALEPDVMVHTGPDWLEYRVFRTILGEHLLVRTSAGWQHLDPATLRPMPAPTSEQVRRLMADAFQANPSRYGQIATVSDAVAQTDTGIEVTLDWRRVTLQQHGRDTEWIDRLYKVHYLQWTGMRSVDRVLGLVGLGFVLALTALGVRLIFRRPGF